MGSKLQSVLLGPPQTALSTLSDHLPQLPLQNALIAAPGNPAQSCLFPLVLLPSVPNAHPLLLLPSWLNSHREAFKNKLKSCVFDKAAFQESSCSGCSLCPCGRDSDLGHCTWTAWHCALLPSMSPTGPWCAVKLRGPVSCTGFPSISPVFLSQTLTKDLLASLFSNRHSKNVALPRTYSL